MRTAPVSVLWLTRQGPLSGLIRHSPADPLCSSHTGRLSVPSVSGLHLLFSRSGKLLPEIFPSMVPSCHLGFGSEEVALTILSKAPRQMAFYFITLRFLHSIYCNLTLSCLFVYFSSSLHPCPRNACPMRTSPVPGNMCVIQ